MYKVGSLYAGIGGICLGFQKAGFQLEWANEYDKRACITYRNNFSHTLIEEDVMQVDIDDLEDIDILTAGFPCQPFSVAGYRYGFDDKRGNHFFRILEMVEKLRPKVLLLENVKNLVGHDSGNTFKIIKKEIISRGFTFDFKVLNTKDYGNVPHNRERIFIVAFDQNIIRDSDFNFQFPKEEMLEKSIKDILSSEIVDSKYYYGPDKYMYNMLKETMTSENTVYQFRRKYVRENKSSVCPTLTANMGTGGHNVPLIKTSEGFRKLTPRECFRFQGFPENFILPDIADSHLYKQAGNSVSVPVISRIACNIKNILKELEIQKTEELQYIN